MDDRTPIKNKIEIISGFPAKSLYFNSDGSGIPLIRIRDIINGYTNTYYSGSHEEKYVVNKGDLLIGMDGEFHTYKWTGTKSLLNQRICKVYTKDKNILSQDYLFYHLKSEIKKIEYRTPATTVKHLSIKDINKIKIPLPPLPEQRKIAEILTTVDDAIEKTDAIIKETQQLKKGLTQKLFTEGIGHTRFKETKFGRIPASWDLVNLNELTTKIQDGNYGESYPKADEMLVEGIPFLTSTAIANSNKIDFSKIKFISESKHKELRKAHITTGDILFTNRGANVGAVAKVPKQISDGNIGPQLTLFRCIREKINTNYLFTFLESSYFRNQVKRLDTGTAMNFFNLKTTNKFKIILPPLKEQQEIASSLTVVDTKIENEQAIKAELEQLKKGLSQVLLTGKVRVKV